MENIPLLLVLRTLHGAISSLWPSPKILAPARISTLITLGSLRPVACPVLQLLLLISVRPALLVVEGAGSLLLLLLLLLLGLLSAV